MNILIYMFLALYHIPYCESRVNNGCTKDFNPEICYYEAHCVSTIDLNINYGNIYSSECTNNYITCNTDYYRGQTFSPLIIFYKNTAVEYDLNRFVNSYIQCATVILDLSFNNFNFIPDFWKLKNIQKLNISHNTIDIAKLYQNHELNSLTEIDFSYNKIKELYVDENHFAYRRLKKLWLSHNEFLSISENVLPKFADLEYLDLSFNRIANISQLTFEGLKQLLFLQLSNNDITDINSSLFRFSKLKELYLSNNKIKNVLVRDFERLNDLEILDLSHNVIETLDKNVFEKLPHLKIIDLSFNLISTIDKQIFNSINYLESVDLTRNEITELPPQLFFQKSLSYFSIKDNNIQGSLIKGTFEGLVLNTKLDLSHQSITNIEDYAFFGLENLLELFLNNNLIQRLAINSFRTLQKLEHLDLSFNKITQLEFNAQDLLSLQSMILHGNQITKIKKTHLHNMKRLQFLDLSFNNLSQIEAQTFKTLVNVNNFLISKNPLSGNLIANIFEGLNSVQVLDLTFTELNVVQNDSFNSMFHLHDLNISNSKLNKVEYNSFMNTGNIKILDLSKNQIETFAINTTHLSNLEQLLLKNNRIKILNDDFVKGILLLNKIILCYNLIEFINDKHFEDQKYLRHVDLSYNSKIRINFSFISETEELQTLILSGSPKNTTFKNLSNISLTNLEFSHSNIQNISELNLSVMEKLQHLKLNNNNVTRLEVGAFSNLINVNEIDISYNNINVIQPGIFKDNYNLKTLNISHNALFELSYGILHGLVSIDVLDISYNLIGSLETERFFEVVTLETLIADHNRITDVPVEDFRGTNLKILSIGDNSLTCDKIVNLKASDLSLIITAIRNVSEEENVHGITCNKNTYQKYSIANINETQKPTNNLSENILLDIRNILLTSKTEKKYTEDRLDNSINMFYNLTYNLEKNHIEDLNKLNNLINNNITLLNEEQKNTNKLLEIILKVFLGITQLKINESLGPVKDNNGTSDFIFNTKNNSKQDFYNTMILEREKILAEIEDKLSLINKRIEPLFTTTTKAVSISKNDKLLLSTESKSFIFIETCLALILFIAVCSVLFKIYKSRCFIARPRSVSLSTRQMADAMDISNV